MTEICAREKTGELLLPMSAVSFPPKSKETRARQPPPLPCGPSSDRRKIFPTTSYTHQERNSTSKKSTKHRAPDRSPRPRPSSRRRRKTSSLFLLLCVYALFFEREETARSKFVLKNSICSLSLSERVRKEKNREKHERRKEEEEEEKKSENDDDDEGAKSFNHY